MPSAARLALALAFCLPFLGTAHGHAVVIQTDPMDGAVLSVAPDRILVRFNEPVSLIAAQVLDASGGKLSETASVGDGLVEIGLPPGLAEGTYVASYRVVSVDGHPVGGSIVFSIGEASTIAAPRASSSNDRIWGIVWTAVRATLNAGVLGSAGAVLFLLVVARSYQIATAASRIATRLAVVGIAAAILSLGVQGGLLTGVPVARIFDTAVWRTGLTSTFGRSALLAIAGLAVIAATAPRPTTAGRAITFAAAVAALSSFAFSGHVVPAGPRWVTIPALLAHTSAVAFWTGSLLPLRAALSEHGGVEAVRRFSAIAVYAVGLLIAAGLLIALLQVRGFSALATTTYGWLLLAKLALVAGLLSLATFNKFRLTPALARRDPGATDTLRRTIAAELAVVAAILIVTATLGTTPPPRALQSGHTHTPESHPFGEHRLHGVSVELASGDLRARVTFSSTDAGANRVEIAISQAGGTTLEAKEVTLTAANPAAGVEPLRRIAEPVRPGVWEVKDLPLPQAGEWSIRVEALVSDFEKPMFEGGVQFR